MSLMARRVQALLREPYWRACAAVAGAGAALAVVCALAGWALPAVGLGGDAVALAAAMLLTAALVELPADEPASDDDDPGSDGRGRGPDPDPDPDAPDAPGGEGLDWERFERDFRAYAERELTTGTV